MPRAKKKRTFEKVGSVKIPWYRNKDGRTVVDGRGYGRKRETFIDHDEAVSSARRIALEISVGGVEVLALTSADRAAFAHASAEALKWNVGLIDAITEWSKARELAAGLPLLNVVPAGVESLTSHENSVGDVVAELMAIKAKEGFHGRYYKGMKSTLEAFAKAMNCAIQKIDAKKIQEYLDSLKCKTRTGAERDEDVGPRRRNNVLKEIRHLFEFARNRSYLREGAATEAKKVGIIKRVKSKIGFLTPEILQIHLRFIDPHFIPWVAINSFSGMRAEEIVLMKDAGPNKDTLRWEDFDWGAKEICVRDDVAKTGIPRRIPILDNLYAWLKPWRDSKATGHVVPSIPGRRLRMDHARRNALVLAEETLGPIKMANIDLTYPHNGYRHSYGSYRMAVLKDMGKLAYEMGNSVDMIKRNYNNPRPIIQAQEYFSIYPGDRAGTNIVQMSML